MFALIKDFYTYIFFHGVTRLMLYSTFGIQPKIVILAAVHLMCLKSKHLMLEKTFFFLIIRFEDVGAHFWPQLNYNRQAPDASNDLEYRFPTNSGASFPHYEQRVR